MKKIMRSVQTMAALLLAAAATTACSGDDSIDDEARPTEPKTYTMTVQATKDDAMTRALAVDGTGALNATWKAGDKVAVLKLTGSYPMEYWALLGQLTAGNVSADGLSCTLTGTFTEERILAAGTPKVGSYLRLIYPGTRATTDSYTVSYTGQDGTLEKIATDFDYCSTPAQIKYAVKVTAFDGTNITTDPVTFTNDQAIVRFRLTDIYGDPFFPTSLTISAKSTFGEALVTSEGLTGSGASGVTGPLTINLDGNTNVAYAALRGCSGMDVTLTANPGTYTYARSNVTFDNGKYYTINVKMQGNIVRLNYLTDDYVARDGDILTGGLSNNKHVIIPDKAQVVLYNVTISAKYAPGIICAGDAHIVLKGTNTVMTLPMDHPAIQAGGSGTTLAISGDGSLTATGGGSGAGIGSGHNGTCGNITINGCTVTATGGDSGAGIGSGSSGTCGTITINDCTVTATGGNGAAGIGSGSGGLYKSIAIGEGITSVTATAGHDAEAPIGKGLYDAGSGSVIVDDVPDWAGAGTTKLNFAASTVKDAQDRDVTRWTLTHK